MNVWKIILATVLIFGAGVLTGGLLVDHVKDKLPGDAETPAPVINARPSGDNHEPAHVPEIPLPRQAERLSKDFVRRLNDALHLNPEQKAAIAKIVADGQERNHVIWTNVAPLMHKVMLDVNQQIRAELTPEQLKQFEELMKQRLPRHSAGTNSPPEVAPPTNPPPPGV
ncbi:MAG: hypothetical protein WAO02_04960 [Verrucomicrobiia bacterium]